MSPRAVYDTNVIVSAALKKESIPASLVSFATQGTVRLFLSRDIMEEYEEVLSRPKFSLSDEAVQGIVEGIRNAGTMVEPKEKLRVSRDPKDDRFLECAVAAAAEYLVTGNKRDFPSKSFRGTKIVSPAEFWQLVSSS